MLLLRPETIKDSECVSLHDPSEVIIRFVLQSAGDIYAGNVSSPIELAVVLDRVLNPS